MAILRGVWIKCVLIVMAAAASAEVLALKLVDGDVVASYGTCSYRDGPGDTGIIRVTVTFKEAKGHTGGARFVSRAVLLYTYDKNGNLSATSAISDSVSADFVGSHGPVKGDGFYMYIGDRLPWSNAGPVTMAFEVAFRKSAISAWPAVNVRAANYTAGDPIAEITGGVYVDVHNPGSCVVIDPETPPQPPINIAMTAPDWNLGVLPLGEGQKMFTDPAEQLCVTYTGSQVSGKSFIINAGSANGIANNRYRLKNVSESSQLVPYTVTLDSGTSKLTLPNTGSSALPLGSSGRTCFVPTFKTFTDEKVKEGDYGDVLRFNVVTKP
ncbi:hypothetical protein [Burkholderia diffusa]|uniref:hypothetical protein n=1 Tax=Burkholderia diffusa TaxID=488732 RepID=UPI000B2AA3D6|nr:hypothetical protein [Burkholderia diffusa]